MSLISNILYSSIVGIVCLLVLEFALGVHYDSIDAQKRELDIEASITHPNADSETIEFTKELVNFRDYKYKAFIGWKGPLLDGEFIATDDHGRRYSPQSAAIDTTRVIHLYGGSTMWGYGVGNAHTIPSFLSRNYNITTINYGEQAYNSRQELNLLIENLDSIKPSDVVVFYDGVNDVYHNCKSTNSVNGHAREYAFKSKLETDFEDGGLVQKTVYGSSLYRLIGSVLGHEMIQSTNGPVVISSNKCVQSDIASKVADFTVNSWKVMSAIVKEKGAIPLCILQPNPYTLKSDAFARYTPYENQIKSVYPLIRNRAEGLDCFVDYSEKLKSDYYTDSCCHLNKDGNRIIADAIWKDLGV
jgi:lysophospholipase L1-like esterase